jgi:hypothetical protein
MLRRELLPRLLLHEATWLLPPGPLRKVLGLQVRHAGAMPQTLLLLLHRHLLLIPALV